MNATVALARAEVLDGIGIITLQDTHRRNALSANMLDEVQAILAASRGIRSGSSS